MKMRS